MEIFKEWLGELVATVFASGWLFERTKRKADALTATQDIYDRLIIDTKEAIETLSYKVHTLQTELKNQEAFWKTRYDGLEGKYKALQGKYNALKKQIENGGTK